MFYLMYRIFLQLTLMLRRVGGWEKKIKPSWFDVLNVIKLFCPHLKVSNLSFEYKKNTIKALSQNISCSV